MGEHTAEGLDFAQGVDVAGLADGAILSGHVRGEPALLARVDGEFFLIGSLCTHYHGPLSEGLIVEDTIRCPWHHACFSLRTGEAVRAPGLDPVSCWRLEREGGKLYAREKLAPERRTKRPTDKAPGKVVIVGGGAAGLVAAQALRAEGFGGSLVMLSADSAAPYDRPNLSKDFLAGSAPEDWLPLRGPDFYEENRIDLRLGTRVESLSVEERAVALPDGSRLPFDALLLATGAEPVRLDLPGADRPNVFYLRSLADSRAIIATALGAKEAVVVGASFIGLEVAASLRARGVGVHVVAPDAVPMERVLGADLGNFVRGLHERHGVRFRLGRTLASIEEKGVTLDSGERLAADLVVVGIGVRPLAALAERAGLAVDRGVLVDEYLETSAPGVYAAGDIARWPDRLTGERIRIEHWVVAERQGQTAARNILGRKEPFGAAPFFWSQHYNVVINYVGHAPQWDRAEMSGRPEDLDCAVSYFRGARKLAVASIFRDVDNLRAEVEFERTIGA